MPIPQLLLIHRLHSVILNSDPTSFISFAKELDTLGSQTLMFLLTGGLVYMLYKQQLRNESSQKEDNASKDKLINDTLKTVTDSITELSKAVSGSISDSIQKQMEMQSSSDAKITKALNESRKEVIESRKEEREFFSQLIKNNININNDV